MNCEVLHKEYRQLKTKVRSVVNVSQKGRSYKLINYRDVVRIKELAIELTLHCKNFVKKLPAADRYDLKNDIGD